MLLCLETIRSDRIGLHLSIITLRRDLRSYFMFKHKLYLSLFIFHFMCTGHSSIGLAKTSLPLIYPLKSKPSVSSTFGTYRINHHHSGIDLYTFEGTPVVAAADGVVSLIKQGSGGYGRAIYLKHKNNFITLYAHLSAFAPQIQELVTAKQKRKELFTQKIRPRKKIHFKAGDIIGWSGTSGTDLCHLHFELRHKNVPINPLTHGLNLMDHQAPTLIAIYADPLDERARVEGNLLPQKYDLMDRPKPLFPLAAALFPEDKLNKSTAEITEETIQSPIDIPAADPTITIWGNVGLSLEVEDRIDGSHRELTPHQIKFYVDNRLIHHLKYESTSYSDKRSSELDFDISRRGAERRLIHRLYRYGPKLRSLKRGSTRPLKRLKKGVYSARVEAIDAAGNISVRSFTIKVEKPPKTGQCRLKRKRLPKRKPIYPLWQLGPKDHVEVSWRPYGLSFDLPKPCDDKKPLEIDLRINGKRAPRHMLSLSPSPKGDVVNLHFNRLDFEKWSKKIETIKDSQKEPLELVDRSVDILLGIRGLADQTLEQTVDSNQHKDISSKPIQKSQNSQTIYWYKLKIHEVKNDSYFENNGIRVYVGKESVFKPYITSITSLPHSDHYPTVSQGYTFAQPWLPMQKANEIFLKRPRTPRKHLGTYLVDGEQRWWVTNTWQDRELGASSTHLASFIIAQDEQSPSIGIPQWDMISPLGPRLIIPIQDDLSGLSKVKLFWDEKEVAVEVQRSWKRLIYTPLQSLKEGIYTYKVLVKDRAGHETKQNGSLKWPPHSTHIIPPQDEARKALEPL